MKTLIQMTRTEDDLNILKGHLKECAEALRKGMEDALETAERSREDKEYYDKVKALRESVEAMLDIFTEIEALREEE